jgi:hypothetical protein
MQVSRTSENTLATIEIADLHQVPQMPGASIHGFG